MIQKVPLHNILFLDIETVPQFATWHDLPEKWKILWEQKVTKQLHEEESPADFYSKRAGILAEFGQIVCISCGVITDENEFKIKSFCGKNEVQLLKEFKALTLSDYFKPSPILCAHNGKEFDFPYLARRMVINQIEIPPVLNLHGKKPWEIAHLDTMELWKFGDYKHFTSLNLLASILDIPTSKDDIDGSQVAHVFYVENDLDRIKTYCEKDVKTVAQIVRRFRNEPLL